MGTEGCFSKNSKPILDYKAEILKYNNEKQNLVINYRLY